MGAAGPRSWSCEAIANAKISRSKILMDLLGVVHHLLVKHLLFGNRKDCCGVRYRGNVDYRLCMEIVSESPQIFLSQRQGARTRRNVFW